MAFSRRTVPWAAPESSPRDVMRPSSIVMVVAAGKDSRHETFARRRITTRRSVLGQAQLVDERRILHPLEDRQRVGAFEECPRGVVDPALGKGHGRETTR